MKRSSLRRFAALLATMLAIAGTAGLSGCGGGGEAAPSSAALQPEAATSTSADAGRATPTASEKTIGAEAVQVRGVIPVGIRRAGGGRFDYDYRLVLQNTGPAVDGVVVRLVEPVRGVEVRDGMVNAGTLPAGGYAVPTDIITVRKAALPLFAFEQHDWLVTLGPPKITGVAAVGAALANANVTITGSNGLNACAQAPIVTNGVGQYTCSVLPTSTAPYLIVVRDPFGFYPPLVSIATTTPAPGTSLVANVTPLTTAIIGKLAPDGNPLSVAANPLLIDLAALAAITANVLTQIQPVLTAIGAPAGYDPFTTQIVAATATQGGNTADQVLETLRFTTVGGETRIGTVDNPGASVPLAGATTPTPPVLPAPSPTLLGLNESLRRIVSDLAQCFALPVSTRVLGADTSVPLTAGGPTVTAMAPACQSAAHPDYLNNGYRFGQRFYGLLNSARMVGAQFQAAEIMLYLEDSTAADNDVAVINLRYIDAGGVVGNSIEVVRKLPGTATSARPTDWWLHGNRRLVDLSMLAFVQRMEQLAPNPGTAPFANAGASRYETGLLMFVNKDGPGSAGMRAARVTGPGLPPAGVVLTRPNPAIVTDQNWLNIRRKDGLTDPASATPAADTGDVFLLQRTQGLAGTAATTVRPNPNAGNPNNLQFPQWAHPLDYGAALGSTDFIDFAQLGVANIYTFEIFYDGETAPRYTYTARNLTEVIPATYAGNLRWHSLAPATLGFLTPGDPLAATQTTLDVGWIIDPFAETVRSLDVLAFGSGATVRDAQVPVVPGANSATATAPAGTTFPALTADGASGRFILLRYRMLDGSFKQTITRFN